VLTYGEHGSMVLYNTGLIIQYIVNVLISQL